MSLANDIEKVSKEMLEDGTVDSIIREQLTNSITEIVRNTFRTYGEVGSEIKKRIESSMLESIGDINFSKYVPDLDAVLTDIVNNTGLSDTRSMLENFKYLMVDPSGKSINVTDLFKEYKHIVSLSASHDGHDVGFDSEEPEYDPIEVAYEFEKLDKPRWSSCERGIITFKTDDTDENNDDPRINIQIPVMRWDWESEEGYVIEANDIIGINNLRHMNSLELLVMRLSRAKTRIIINKEYDDDTVYFDEKPEVDWS